MAAHAHKPLPAAERMPDMGAPSQPSHLHEDWQAKTHPDTAHYTAHPLRLRLATASQCYLPACIFSMRHVHLDRICVLSVRWSVPSNQQAWSNTGRTLTVGGVHAMSTTALQSCISCQSICTESQACECDAATQICCPRLSSRAFGTGISECRPAILILLQFS